MKTCDVTILAAREHATPNISMERFLTVLLSVRMYRDTNVYVYIAILIENKASLRICNEDVYDRIWIASASIMNARIAKALL